MTERAATAVVLLAHGSRSEDSNRFHGETCRKLADRIGAPVSPAFLELAEPNLTDAVGTVVAEGAAQVVVLPYFLAPGRHVQRDVPALVEAARAAHPDASIIVGPLFGADAGVLDVLAGQLAAIGSTEPDPAP